MKISLSNADRGILALNTYNNYKNRKVNEKILEQQKKSNRQLAQMHKELALANEINRRVLENQIREVELKEEQKYYKALSFHSYEIINEISKTDDKIVLCYVVDSYYQKVKTDLLTCNDVLDEINDKLFNKESIDKLEIIKTNTEMEMANYQKSVLSNIDDQLLNFNNRKSEILKNNQPKINSTDFEIKSKTNVLRIIGIVILGILTLLFSTTLLSIFGENKDAFIPGLVFTLIFGVPFYILLRKEINWINNYHDYQLNQKNKKIEFDKKQGEMLDEKRALLLDDPIYDSMVVIQKDYPTFEKLTLNINNLSSNFYEKWEKTLPNIV